MKKHISLLFIAGTILSGCTNKKAIKQAIVDSVMKIHEKVMSGDEQLMKNKVLLDSAVAHNSTADIKDSVYKHLEKVNLADSAMSDWMHKFDYEQKGKSEDETIAYMKKQKAMILHIDTMINAEVSSSDTYLKKIKMK